MTQLHVLPTFPLLVVPSTIDHIQLDEAVVFGFLMLKVNLHTSPDYTSF